MFRIAKPRFVAGIVIVFACVSLESVVAAPVAPPAISGSTLTPAQSAWLQAETRRAADLFVRRVVAITNMPPDTVRQAIPADGRITDPAARTVSAIEKFGGKPLGDDQKAAIRAAEEDRRQMIANARLRAGGN